MFVSVRRNFLLIIAASFLVGCVQTPLTKTISDALGWSQNVDERNLNPDYRYLRVSSPERAFLMVLGYVDSSPDGDIETWYSNAGQVMRLQNGRLLSAKGFAVDWTSVTYKDLPLWSQATTRPRTRFIRYHDEMPGYKVGVFDMVTIQRIDPPQDTRIAGIPPTQLTWLEETTDTSPRARPSARYGLSTADGKLGVVYAEQCFGRELCLAWQTWPTTP